MDRFQELSKIALDELSEVFARMSDENVRELLEEIKKADRIFLLGAGREGLSTREFAMRLMHLGKESHWVWDDTTPSMGKGDLFICACGSADVAHENTLCDNAKKTGATLILITPSAKGHILEIADGVIGDKRCAGFLCIVTKCIFMCHVCTSACADEQIAFAHRRGGIIPYPMRFLPQMHQPHCKLSRRKSLSPCSKQKNAIRFLDFLQ